MLNPMLIQADVPPLHYIRSARTLARESGSIQLADSFELFEGYYQRRLWHQINVEMDRFIAIPEAAPYLIRFYYCFVRDFADKLNKLSLVAGIVLAVARLLPENKARIEFLLTVANNLGNENLAATTVNRGFHKTLGVSKNEKSVAAKEELDTETVSAQLLARAHAAYYQLIEGQFDLVSQEIRVAERTLNKLDNADSRVSCAFYRVASDFYKSKSEYTKFYRTSLLYFSCLSASNGTIHEIEAQKHVHDLSLAVLLSPEIYNFGELLTHPILESNQTSSCTWLRECLKAFNHGNLIEFERLLPYISAEPLLATKTQFLREKIGLMALVDYSFNLTVSERMLSFVSIAERVGVAIDSVEMLVMRAMSLDLVRGSIDQVRQSVRITWVAPRVLDRKQIEGLSKLIEKWHSRVEKAGVHLSDAAGELF